MAGLNILMGADVLLDFIDERDGYEEARMLLAAGVAKQVSLWVPATQILSVATDIASGKKKKAAIGLDRLRKIVALVNVASVGELQVEAVLDGAGSEEALLNALVRELKAEIVVTNEDVDLIVPAYTAKKCLAYLDERGLVDFSGAEEC